KRGEPLPLPPKYMSSVELSICSNSTGFFAPSIPRSSISSRWLCPNLQRLPTYIDASGTTAVRQSSSSSCRKKFRSIRGSSSHRLEPEVLDALLCRLVFTCYLFDRDIIGLAHLELLGIPGAGHLRDVLGHQPRAEAKDRLYQLFKKLEEDFNGDLFSDNLDAE